MKKKTENKLLYYVIAIALVAVCSYFGIDIYNQNIDEDSNSYKDIEQNFEVSSNDLKIHFVDVGQADAIIIEKDNQYALVDAGTNSSETALKNYIDSKNITDFKYLFGTHAHEDHIGGIDKIIKNYNISSIIFPKVTATTKTFESFVDAAKQKNLKFITPKIGDVYNLSDVSIEIVAPNSSKYDDANNYSIVLKVTYQEVSYLLTGDAEALAEKEILKNGIDISADVLKVGHHGSNSSTSKEFLDTVNPKYAIISVGENNDYSHPSDKILDRLKAKDIVIYRTDLNGTIVSVSDGKNIKFILEKE